MSTRPPDTTSEAHAVQTSVWERLAPSERVLLAFEMSEDARLVALAGLAARRPDLVEEELIRELVRLMHGVDIGAERGPA